MASTVLRCDYPGCDTELKPLFSSMYCPNEDNHGKAKYGRIAITPEVYKASFGGFGIPAWVPACHHPITITQGGVTKCTTCGEEMTTPYP